MFFSRPTVSTSAQLSSLPPSHFRCVSLAVTRDSRVNSRRAQRVSSRGFALTHLRLLNHPSWSRNPPCQPCTTHTHTHTHDHTRLLPAISTSSVTTRRFPSTLIYPSTREPWCRCGNRFNNACTHRPLNLALRKLRVYLG